MSAEIDALRPEHPVGEFDGLFGNIDSDRAVCRVIAGIWRTDGRTASAAVDDAAVGFMRSLCRQDVGAGASAGVGDAKCIKPVERFGVDVAAQALEIRPV